MIDEKKYKASIDKKMPSVEVTPPAAPAPQPMPEVPMPEMPQFQMPEMPSMPQIQMPEMPQIQMPQYQAPIMMPQYQTPAMMPQYQMPQTPPVCCPFLMNMQCPILQSQTMPATGGVPTPYMNYPSYMNPYGTSQFTAYNPMGTMQY